ncbi:hypothetical protein CALCODRAFT_511304 [Calocera cornea HHB12733]|uniref:Uncharacterized protein n=1 Tax=Calocera cornea HHB12733 TaxID=1353952 RepID=A0A165DUV5_9BASI|nr:hypothetical protein CALCODRAFT_511304 [Calocera cornea HHB12733]
MPTTSLQSLFSKSEPSSIREALQQIVNRHENQKPYFGDLWTRFFEPIARNQKIYSSGPYRSYRRSDGIAAFQEPKDIVTSTITACQLPVCDAMSAIEIILANAFPPTNDAQARLLGTIAYKWHRALYPDYGYARVTFIPHLPTAVLGFIPAGITVPPTHSTIPEIPAPDTSPAAPTTTDPPIPHPTALTQPRTIPREISGAKTLQRQKREVCLEDGLGKEKFVQYKDCVAIACATGHCIDQFVPEGGPHICMCAELLLFMWLLQLSKTPVNAKKLKNMPISLPTIISRIALRCRRLPTPKWDLTR